jgi:hypothetical protein
MARLLAMPLVPMIVAILFGPAMFPNVDPAVRGSAIVAGSNEDPMAGPAVDIDLDPKGLGFDAGVTRAVSAWLEEGRSLSPPRAYSKGGIMHILPGAAPAFRYRLSRSK